MTNVESDANKETSKNLTAQWMWNWVMSEHLIVQTEENLDYPMTETRKEHRSLAFASNNETSGEMSVQLELLQEMAEVPTVLQKVQQGNLFQVMMFYAVTLLLEEGNEYLE